MGFAVLLLSLLAFQALALKPSLKTGINGEAMGLVKDLVVKEIQEYIKDVKLPDHESSFLLMKILYTNVMMHVMSFDPSQIQIDLVNDSNEFTVRGTNLNFAFTSDLTVQFLFFNHRCRGEMKVSDGGFVARIGINTNGPRLSIEVKSLSLNIDSWHVDISVHGNIFDHIACWVVDFFLPLFFGGIKQSISEMLPPAITAAVNAVLSRLPDDILLLPKVAVKYAFTSAPRVTSGYLVTPFLMYAHVEGHADPPTEQPPDLPDLNSTCHKGFQMFLSDYFMKSLFKTLYETNMLTFSTQLDLLGFQVDVNCLVNAPPKLEFNGNIAVEANATCTAKSSIIAQEVDFKTGLVAVLTERISKSTMYFKMEKLAMTSLEEIGHQSTELKDVLALLNDLIDDLRKHINDDIEKRGIPLPVFRDFDISDVEESLVEKYIYVCGLLKPKINVPFDEGKIRDQSVG